jgi:hypothetical protein
MRINSHLQNDGVVALMKAPKLSPANQNCLLRLGFPAKQLKQTWQEVRQF